MSEIQPLAIGPKNAESMCGVTWRWLRDHAGDLGLEFIEIDGKRVLLATKVLAALEQRALQQGPEPSEVDELAALRSRLGKRRVG